MADKITATAKIVDGILVISLPDAINPIVWQMELGQSKASALEVRAGADGTHILTLKTPRQDVQDIAAFTNRDQAVKALMTVSNALENGSGQTAQTAKSSSCCVANTGHTWSAKRLLRNLILGFFTVIGFMTFLSFALGFVFSGPRNAPHMADNQTAGKNDPISADEFLEER